MSQFQETKADDTRTIKSADFIGRQKSADFCMTHDRQNRPIKSGNKIGRFYRSSVIGLRFQDDDVVNDRMSAKESRKRHYCRRVVTFAKIFMTPVRPMPRSTSVALLPVSQTTQYL